MSEEKSPAATEEKAPASKSAVYFRNARYAKESVVVGVQETDTPGFPVYDRVRFDGYVERVRGDDVRVGYLQVQAGSEAAKAVEALPHTEKISEKEYKAATTGKNVRVLA